MPLLLVLQLLVWNPVKYPDLHAGHWTACPGEERVLEHWGANGRMVWEMHFGVDDEFALYDHRVNHDDEHDAHDSPANRLGPAYKVDGIATLRGARQWTDAALGLWISVVRGGETPEACQGFFILIRRQQ